MLTWTKYMESEVKAVYFHQRTDGFNNATEPELESET